MDVRGRQGRNEQLVESSRRADLVADSSKYGRSAPVRIGHLSEINHFVTDATPPPALDRICTEHGVVLDVAPENGHGGPAPA